jgi:molybdate transport system substrate-binding protein
LALVTAVLLLTGRASAADVLVAVAANFARPVARIAEDFARATGHKAIVSIGATGTLFAQIEHGAPFEVFLAADRATPAKLEAEGLGVPGSRFTYAVGVLALWSARPGYVDPNGEVLARGGFMHIAIADPKLAPYGAAAIETLSSLRQLEALRPKIVQGDSIGQAYQFVASGNAELGFVALSQLVGPGVAPGGSYWIVPASLHAPIAQDAVILKNGVARAAANAFCDYLRSEKAQSVVRAFGYGTATPTPP